MAPSLKNTFCRYPETRGRTSTVFTASKRPVNSSTSPNCLQTTSATLTSGGAGAGGFDCTVLEHPEATATSMAKAAATRNCIARWKAAVLEPPVSDAQRFSELKRAIPGITQRTLSQHLRELQTAGIVDRTVHPDTPPRVVYAITPLGESLRPLLDAMCRWGKSHSAAMALKKIRASDR